MVLPSDEVVRAQWDVRMSPHWHGDPVAGTGLTLQRQFIRADSSSTVLQHVIEEKWNLGPGNSVGTGP